MSSSDIAIAVRGVSKAYTIRHQRADASTTLAEAITRRLRNPFRRESESEQFWALRDVSFDVKRGEVVGIIGRNGAGKSTLLKILSRITEMTTGEVDLYGRVGSLLEVGTGFHQELTGRENIFLNGAILGMTRAEIKSQFDAIVDFAGVDKFLDTPVKRYSSGMYVRLAFAVAAHLRSEILIIDEVLAVGDAEFQKKCLGKMKEVSTDGRTVLFVSHNLQSISLLCSHALYLEAGQLNCFGNTAETINRYTTRPTDNDMASHPPSRRRGTGEYRFKRVAPLRAVFAPDSEKVVAWEVERQNAAVSSMFIQAMIVDELGQTCAQLDSRLVDIRYDDAPRFSGQFRFRTPWLKPGEYRVDLLLCSGAIIDAFEGACRFTVSPVLPYPQSAPIDSTERSLILADFEWNNDVFDHQIAEVKIRAAPTTTPEDQTTEATTSNSLRLESNIPSRLAQFGSNAVSLFNTARRRALFGNRQPIVGYAGGAPGNLGDDVMYWAAQRHLGGVRLERLQHHKNERRLANLGLGGKRRFDAILLGGGTLINSAWLELIEHTVEQGLPIWCIGTGVGAWGMGQHDDQDLSKWARLLPFFRKIGLRGPLSGRKLERLGVTNYDIVGDFALVAGTTCKLSRDLRAQTFAVNMISSDSFHTARSSDWREALIQGIANRIEEGWSAIGLAMHSADIAPTEAIMRDAGVRVPRVYSPRTFDEYAETVQGCSFGIGMRLHMAVLGTSLGLPVLSIAYCDKFTDYSESVGLQGLKIRIDRTSAEQITSSLKQLAATPELQLQLAEPLIQKYRDRLGAAIAELRASVAPKN